METAKLSQKYQIVVPRGIREKMKLEAGARLSIHLVDEKRAIIVKYPKNYVEAMQGLGKDVWRKLGGTRRYIKQERALWSRRSALTR